MDVTAWSYHPLAVSWAAHARHGDPLSPLETNVSTELWMVNRMRATWRFSALVAAIRLLLPELQRLRDLLVDIGVLPSRRQMDEYHPDESWEPRQPRSERLKLFIVPPIFTAVL